MDNPPTEPISVLIHEALIPDFKAWLFSRGLMLARLPAELQPEDGLESFMAAPTEETMRRLKDV